MWSMLCLNILNVCFFNKKIDHDLLNNSVLVVCIIMVLYCAYHIKPMTYLPYLYSNLFGNIT